MGTSIKAGKDVVSFLKEQHQRIKMLFERVLEAKGEQREKAFFELRRLLAVHETAEEEIVHPAARRTLENGEQIVRARLQEENTAKDALTQLEKLDVGSSEFDVNLRSLRKDVVAHAEAEEREEFDILATALDAARLERMRKAAEFAESIAPTRPHAGVESAVANLLTGPFVSMLDRSRDLISGKA
jgi:hemerythrin superfamily protein